MFIAYLEQKGEGCDYTIACGRKMIRLEGATIEEAMRELKDKVIWPDDKDGFPEELYRNLAKATVFEVACTYNAPVSGWYSEEEERNLHLERSEKARVELAELARLKNKYAGAKDESPE